MIPFPRVARSELTRGKPIRRTGRQRQNSSWVRPSAPVFDMFCISPLRMPSFSMQLP